MKFECDYPFLYNFSLDVSHLHHEEESVPVTQSTQTLVSTIGQDTPSFIFSGNRIIDLGWLLKQLERNGCTVCKTPLQLSRTTREWRYGLGSILYVKCICGAINHVTTGKRHFDPAKKKTQPVFDINTKAVAGNFFILLF